nr:DUF748 domain-containing protein [Marinigracilibium pacificum]
MIVASFSGKRLLIEKVQSQISRKVEVGSLIISPLTASLSINHFIIYEKDEETPFLSIENISVGANFSTLFSDEITISELELSGIRLKVVQGKDELNISDLESSLNDLKDQLESQSFGVKAISINEISVEDATLEYQNTLFGGSVEINILSILAKLAADEKQSYEFSGECNFAERGDVKFDGVLNLNNGKYKSRFKVNEFDIGFALPFLDKALYAEKLDGLINADISIGGNIDSLTSEANGVLEIQNLSLFGPYDKSLLHVSELKLTIDTVSAYNGVYYLSDVILTNPSIDILLIESGNNIIRKFPLELFLTSDFDSLMVNRKIDPDSLLSEYKKLDYIHSTFLRSYNSFYLNLKEIIQQFSFEELKIDSMNIEKGYLQFTDYSNNEPFHLLLEEGSATMNSFSSLNENSTMTFNSRLNYSGLLSGRVIIKSITEKRIHIDHRFTGLKIVDFSPFTDFYIYQPFWDGEINLSASSDIQNNYFSSQNDIVITNLEVGEKIHGSKNKKIPSRVAVGLMKDVNGEVKISIPVKGELTHPETDFFPNVGKVVKDLVIKTAAVPVKLITKPFKKRTDNIHEIKFNYLDTVITNNQKRDIKNLAKILKDDKLNIELIHYFNRDWEANQYALFQLKRVYYLFQNGDNGLKSTDSLKIVSINKYDPGFLSYLSGKIPVEENIYDINGLALEYLGKDKVYSLIDANKNKRERALMDYLNEKSDINLEGKRIIISYPDKIEVDRYFERPAFKVKVHGIE